DADTAHLRAVFLAALQLALVPLEQRRALVERLLDERAGDVLPRRLGTGRGTEQRLSLRRVEAADRYLIDPKLARCRRQHRLNQHVRLRATRLTLRPARRRVRQHRHPSEAHRHRLIRQRRDDAGVVAIALALERTVVARRHHVEREDAALFGETDLHPAAHARTAAADEVLFLAADAHHHGDVRLLRQQHRNEERDGAGDLAAEPAPGVLADDDDVFRRDADPTGDARDRLRGALRTGVDVYLAVLPVRHHRPRFERLVAGVWRDVCLVEHERSFLEARVEIAVRPFFGRVRHHRQASGVELRRFRRCPLDLANLGTRRALRLAALPGRGRRSRWRYEPVVA